ncbi:hypothetical protein ACIQOV_12480 [Kitasatospora sp. NPDC091257]|uniref:hypothetical protein n=1 Tax=Kitasatospora sp. NPDC091257 TaxID=3364084 RepID=UPI0037FA58EB
MHWLADRGSDPRATDEALAHFPSDPSHFTLVFHGKGPDGAPHVDGKPVPPRELARTALDLYDRGVWDGRPLRLAGCDAGRGGADSYAGRFVAALREQRPALKVEVDAPGGTLWLVPDRVAGDGSRRLVVTRDVGFDSAGLPRVEPGGHWVRLTAPAEHAPAEHAPAEHVQVVATELPSHQDGGSAPLTATPEHRIVTPDPQAHEFGAGRKHLYNAPEYETVAQNFERSVGLLAYRDERALQAARGSAYRLYEVLKAAHGDPTGEQVYRVFLSKDPTSAGQVGEHLTRDEFHELLANGNLRELMTAFFNAAYAHDGTQAPGSYGLKQVLNGLTEHGSPAARLRELGLDTTRVPQQLDYLNSTTRKVSHALTGGASYFDKDYFATGAVAHRAPMALQREYRASSDARTPRTETNPPELDRKLIEIRMPLSPRETTFQGAEASRTLQWEPGNFKHDVNTASTWYGETRNTKGMQLSTGVSATAAKMLGAFRALKVPDVPAEDMLLALVGWMLPLGDHSLYEILKGAELAGELPPVPSHLLTEAAAMYRHVPGLPESTLRRELGMLPHESVYHALASRSRRNGGFEEEGLESVRRVWQRMVEPGQVPYPFEREWLMDNGLTREELGARLSVAHVEALNIYTGKAYPLINVLLKFDGPLLHTALTKQIDTLLTGKVEAVPSMLLDHPELGGLIASPGPKYRTPEHTAELSRMARELLPEIEKELRIHAEMIIEALDRLPAVTGVVYRGEWGLGRLDGPESLFTAAKPGNKQSSAGLLSTSRLEETAQEFLAPDEKLAQYRLAHRVLARIRLAGENGVDITPFSRYRDGEREILVKPDTVLTVTGSGTGSTSTGPYERIDYVENGSARPFEWQDGSPQWPRQLHEKLRSQLARLANATEVRFHRDLWQLAKAAGAHVGLPDARRAQAAAPDEVLVRRATEHLWDAARITATLHEAVGHGLAELTGVSLVATLARTELGLSPDHRITQDDLQRFTGQVTGGTGTGDHDLRRLLAVAQDVEYTDHTSALADLRTAWEAVGRADTEPVVPGEPGLYLLGDRPADHDALVPLLTTLQFRDDFLTVVLDTVGGRPALHGTALTPAEAAHALFKLVEDGSWDVRRPLRLLATDLASDAHRSYADQMLNHLWRMDRRIHALAAAGKVWIAASPLGTTHLLVAEKVGLSLVGEQVHVGPGNWVWLEHGSRPEKLGPYFADEKTEFRVSNGEGMPLVGPAPHTVGLSTEVTSWETHPDPDPADDQPVHEPGQESEGKIIELDDLVGDDGSTAPGSPTGDGNAAAGQQTGQAAQLPPTLPPVSGPVVHRLPGDAWVQQGRPLTDTSGGFHGWVLDGTVLPEFGYVESSSMSFEIVGRVDADGLPTVDGHQVTSWEMARLIADLKKHGYWSGTGDIELAVPRLGATQGGVYLATLHVYLSMRGVQVTLRAPKEDLWFVPFPGRHIGDPVPSGGGRTFVASSSTGYDSHGFPVVATGGTWMMVKPDAGQSGSSVQMVPAVLEVPAGYSGVPVDQVATELPSELRLTAPAPTPPPPAPVSQPPSPTGTGPQQPPSPTFPAPASTGQDGQAVVGRPPVGLGGGEMPVPGPLHEWVQALDHLSSEDRRELVADEAYLTGLREELGPEDFVQAAARLLVEVDPRAHQPVAARRTAEDLVVRMLANKEVADRLLASGVRVVVVPRDVPMTEVPGFAASGHGTGDGRDWSLVRGSSGHGLVLITEENLLGTRTPVGPHRTYAEGYSTSAHELAHAIHEFGLTEAQRELVGQAFADRSVSDALAELFGEESVSAWPDGGLTDGGGNRVGNYSARNEHEFFAQLVTAYFGHNHGSDPLTGLARNNGAEWVRENVPELVPLLEHLFGADPRADHPEPANQVSRAEAEEQLFTGFREFMESTERESRSVVRPSEDEVLGRLRAFMDSVEGESRSVVRPGEEEVFGRLRAFMDLVEGESRSVVRPSEDEVLDGFREFIDSTTRTEGQHEDDGPVLQPGDVVTEANGTQHTVLGPVLPARPPRIDEHGLAASDVLIGLGSTRTQLLEHFTSRFAQVLHGEDAAARTLAETLFGAETLQAKLTALSRGEVWDVPFSVGTWTGTVRVGADLGRSTFVRAADDFEFEYGSERQTSVGVTGDRLLQLNVGAQAKFKFGKPADLTETVGYQHGWQHGTADAQASRMVARGKTSETAALFDTVFRLKAEFLDLGRRTVGVFREVPSEPVPPVDVQAQVAVPLRETGAPQPAVLPLLPPPGAGPGGGRLSGSHIVTDVWALRRGPGATEEAEGIPLVELNAPRTAAKGMAEFVAGFEAQAREHFGSTWPALRARLLEQVDLGTLHQDLKALMSGETRTIEVDGLLGPKAVITLKNARIHTIEPTAELPPTEFNIATGTSRSHTEQDTTESGWQFPLVGSATGSAKSGGAGLGAGVRTGREKVVLNGGGDELSLGTKVKTAGVVFEGEARIEVEFGAFGRVQRVQARSVDAGLGFRVVVDRSETSPVTPGQVEPAPHPDHAPLPPGALVPHPPSGIWHGSAAYTGLPETTVVRDVRSVAPLHARLDELGRAQLGAKAWSEVREDVLRAFSQSAVGAHLVGMTQDVPLRSPAVALGPLSKLGLGVTAHVAALTYRREQASADLNPVRESTTFESKRLLDSDTWNVSAQGFGKGPVHTRENVLDESGKPFTDTLQGTATVTREVRDRDGWRGGTSAKSYASGKYRSAQVLYDARFELQLTLNGKPHGEHVVLEASLSMEQAHTRPQARNSRVIGNPFDGAAPRPDVPLPGPEHTGQAPANLRVPDRLGHSDVVLGVGRRGPSVLDEVQRLLGTVGPVSAQASVRLASQLDGAGLTASLSRLSRGGRLSVAVDTGSWKGKVEVTVAPLALRHRRTVDGFEFELGSQQRTVVGYSWDRLNRWRAGAALKGTVPHVTVTGDYARTRDSVRGLTIERTGGTGSRGKSVETAELFDGDAVFTVRFMPERFQRSLAGTTAAAPVLVAAPHRDVVLPPAGHNPPALQLPDKRLGSSDIVTRVHLEGADGTVHTGPEAVTTVVAELQPKGRAALGRDWEGMKAKLLDALDFDKLHPLLKPMTSGHEIVLTHGRSTVRITASVDRVTKSGDAPQVEFNIGSSTQTAFTSSEAGTNSGSGQADSLGLTVLGTVGTGVSAVVGGGVAHTRRQDALDHRRDVVVTGTAVKTKLAAEAHRAVIRLSVVMERRPAVPLSLETRPVVPAVRRIRRIS